MLSKQIENLIDTVKALPNSMERNKVVSKLQDAYAWAKVMDVKQADRMEKSIVADIDMEAIQRKAEKGDLCICEPEAYSPHCKVHGVQFS